MPSQIQVDKIQSANGVTTYLDSGTLSNLTFPVGHIIQSVYNPTMTNTSTSANTTTTRVGKADAINQITITSGNGVLIYCHAFGIIDGNSNSYGNISIHEGTVASLGTALTAGNFGNDDNNTIYAAITLMAYDSTPASTTPSYAVACKKGSSGTTSCSIGSFDFADTFKFFMFEVKQ